MAVELNKSECALVSWAIRAWVREVQANPKTIEDQDAVLDMVEHYRALADKTDPIAFDGQTLDLFVPHLLWEPE